MHDLGAVQPTAPQATRYGHCWDGDDVMCHQEGSPEAQQRVCPPTHETLFDSGDDDYFAVAPPAGSYLATSGTRPTRRSSRPRRRCRQDRPRPLSPSLRPRSSGSRSPPRAASPQVGVRLDGWALAQRPANGYCLRGLGEGPTDAVATWTCSKASAGSTVTSSATATRTSDGLKSLVTVDVTLRHKPGPALQVYVTPDVPVGGDWFNVGAQACDGVLPYTYTWTHDGPTARPSTSAARSTSRSGARLTTGCAS